MLSETAAALPNVTPSTATISATSSDSVLSGSRGQVPLYAEDAATAPASSLLALPATYLRALFLRILASQVKVGVLIFRDTTDNYTQQIGQPPAAAAPAAPQLHDLHPSYHLDQPVHLTVRSSSFYLRVMLGGLLGFCQAYMAAECDVGDAVELSRLLVLLGHNELLNTPPGSKTADFGGLSWVLKGLAAAHHFLLRRNTRAGAKANIEQHYDLSNELFATFLGPTMMYSCAYWPDNSLTLDQAQWAKLDLLLDKLKIVADDHVLEIGCGWGECAIRMVQRFGCRVTGITLSKEQLALAQQRVEAAGLSERITFKLIDYRDMRGTFDKIVSIEMLEAVGHEFLGEFYAACERLLAPNGLAAVQVITMPDCRYESYRQSADFINTYIFPGGCCPSLSALAAAQCQRSTLNLEHLENLGPHYATTLAIWQARFLAAVPRVLELGFDTAFVRRWALYFSYCEAGFALRLINVHQLLYSRPGNSACLASPPTPAAEIALAERQGC